jgi:diguanylate cyclase (GGDEF)-like protein
VRTTRCRPDFYLAKGRRRTFAQLFFLLLLFASPLLGAQTQQLSLDVQILTRNAAGEEITQPITHPGWRNRVLSSAQPRARLRIAPALGQWPKGEWVLQLKMSPMHQAQLEIDGKRGPALRMLNPQPGMQAGHGDLAFRLQTLPANGAPLFVDIDTRGAMATTIAVRLLPAVDYERKDAAWLAYAGASLAVMVAMALMALLFAAYLRDSSFIWYATYLAAYVWILGLQSGFLAAPLGIVFASEGAPISGRFATAAAVACAAMFLDRFANLRQYAPRLRWGLHALAVGIVLSSLISLIPEPSLRQLGRSMTNPMIIIGGPLLLMASLWAAMRGSRYGLIFAIGWAPLLSVTVMGSMQLYGFFHDWLWLDHAGMAAGAFEALVLSAGLAYRSMELRRDRDAARRLAEVDPLTGLLNRRAWSERVRVLQREEAPLSVLFFDLDHFKALNDRYGHDLGDRALAEVAACLQSGLGTQDLLARHGGEELLAALPGCSLERAAHSAEQLRQKICNLEIAGLTPEDPRIGGLSISVGVAQRQPAETLESLVRRADAAMYAAKRAGRNCVEVDAGSAAPQWTLEHS